MRILLVYPTSKSKYKRGYLPPFVPTLLAALTPEKHDITVVNDAVEDVPFGGVFDLVAITAMTVQATRAYKIAQAFQERRIPVVIGGFHAAVLPDDVALHADSVVIGDAEHIWQEILSDVENGKLKPQYIGEKFDLQTQNVPRWDLLDLSKYERVPWLKLPIMPIYTTRGCPMGCEFCSVTLIHGKKYRHRPIAHVMEELDSLSAWGKRFYFIIDDNITGDPAYSKELFEALRDRKDREDINWFAQASVTIAKHPELIDLAAESGCSSVFMGLESLNQKTLGSMGKQFNHVEQYSELFERLYSTGIIPFVSMIFGFDEDTEETFQRTVEHHDKNNIMLSAWWMLSPAPGTPFCKRMEDEGRVLKRDWARYDATNLLIRPKQFTIHNLAKCYWKYYNEYFDRVDAINRRIEEKYPNIPDFNYKGSKYMQGVHRKKVANRLHPFAMGNG